MWSGTIGGCLFPANTVGEIRCKSTTVPNSWLSPTPGFANAIGLAGGLMFGEGIVLLVHGLKLGLRPFPFYADTAFCLLLGAGIWMLRKEAGSKPLW